MARPKLAKLLDGVRLRARARLIRRAGLFDDAFYLAQCGGAPEARRDPLRHYLARGEAAGLDPNALFDTSWYLERHAWVARYPKGPLVHYLRYGARQGLDPSPAFDTASYLEACPEARASGLSPLAHYLRHGKAAGVPPSPWDPAGRAEPDGGEDEALRAAVEKLVGAPGLALAPRDRVLVVGGLLPAEPDAAAARTLALVRRLAQAGHEVAFASDATGPAPGDEALRASASPILRGLDAARAHLEAEGGTYRHAVLCGSDAAHRFLATVRAFAPNARLAHARAGAGPMAAVERAAAESADVVVAAADEVAIPIPIPTPTATPTSTSTSTATPTATPSPTATATPLRRLDRPRTGRVLVVGVYLADQPNWAEAIAAELSASRDWSVEQRWVAAGRSGIPGALRAVTAFRAARPAPKFELLNRLLADAEPGAYDHVLVSDDDIALPRGFVDRYLALVERHDLALAQPARTHDSFVDHRFVEQLDGLDARRTRFVEIGPLFSIRRDALPLLAPFDLASPMGWGYDFAWPVVIERAGLAMGVVDATPVAHTLRKPVVNYDLGEADRAMRAYLAAHPHLEREDAFRILEAFPGEPS